MYFLCKAWSLVLSPLFSVPLQQVRTFFPRTVEGLQNIIRLARSQGARVRASGIKHTTTPFIWGVENARQNLPGHSLEYVIAMVPQEGNFFIQNRGWDGIEIWSQIIQTCLFSHPMLVSDQLAYARGTEGWESDYEELVFVEGLAWFHSVSFSHSRI